MPLFFRVLGTTLPLLIGSAACTSFVDRGEGFEPEEQTPPDEGDRSGTRLKRIWLSASDDASFPWTQALWDARYGRPCMLGGALDGSQGPPYCIHDPGRTLFDTEDFSDADCSLPAIEARKDVIVSRSGCDYRIFEKVEGIRYLGTTYRRDKGGRCMPVARAGYESWLSTRSAPSRLPRLVLTPTSGPGRLHPWRIATEDGLRVTAFTRGVYDSASGTICRLGAGEGEGATDECRVVGLSPLLDRTCGEVVGVPVPREECLDAPLATKPPRVASQLLGCHQHIFPVLGSVVPPETTRDLRSSTCGPYSIPPEERVASVGAAFAAATFRRVVPESGARIRPVLSVAEDGTVLAVDHYWDAAQQVDCSILWRDGKARCEPVAVESIYAFRSPSCEPQSQVNVVELATGCEAPPARVFTRLPGLAAGEATEAEVGPALEGTYFRWRADDSGGRVCAPVPRRTALLGRRIRTVQPVSLTLEVR